MKKPKVLDSFAVLVLLNREEGFKKIENIFRNTDDERIIMCAINVGEVYYIVAKNRSLEQAENFLNYLQATGVEITIPDYELIIESAKIKASHQVSYADSFAIATAVRYQASVITGDLEFRSVEDIVNVEWI